MGARFLDRNYTLLNAIEKFGTIPGKKALHKILYFTNLQTGDFIYRWNNYGPYSDEVQQFFDDAYLDNITNVQEEILNNDATQYNTSLTQLGNQTLQSLKEDDSINHEKINNAIDFSYNLLQNKSPRQMELLASTHYIVSYDKDLDSRQIWEIINTQKPESNFTLDEIEESLKELHDVNLA